MVPGCPESYRDEGRIVLIFGIVTIIVAVLFWKVGSTPSAKAMLFPLLTVGILFSAIGGGMLFSNHNRMIEYPQTYQDNPAQFVKSEKERTENL